jgi:hypothetical protein
MLANQVYSPWRAGYHLGCSAKLLAKSLQGTLLNQPHRFYPLLLGILALSGPIIREAAF